MEDRRSLFENRILLILLRGGSLSLLLFLLFDPLLHLFLPRVDPPLLPVLIDISKSMSLPAGAGSTRIEEVQRFLLKDPFLELKKKGESPIWVFSKVPERWTKDSLSLEGNVTDIGSALKGVKKDLGREISALFLFSDGGHNLGEDPLKAAREGGFPIYPVKIGGFSPKGDISIERVRVSDLVYAGDRVPLEVHIEAMGLGEREVEITLKEKERILAKERIGLTEEPMKQTKILHFVPETPGFHSYEVEIETVDGELSHLNNSRTFACEVLKGKMKPLILAGSPTWNLSFLKNSLLRDEKLDPDLFVLLKDGAYLFQTQKDGNWREEVLSRFPFTSPRDLKEYDFFILLDIGIHPPQRDLLPNPFTNLLEKAVSEGKSLLLFGSSYTSREEMNRLLPVILSPGISGAMDGELHVELTEEGKSHPLLLLDEDPLQNERIWKNLPPFPPGDRVLGAKSGATILAVYSEAKTPQGKMPAIAFQRFGEGRVVWIGLREFWRMGFLSLGMLKETRPQEKKGGEIFDRFVGDLSRWLIQREGKGRLRVTTEKKVYSSGEPIPFEASLFNESLEPLDGAGVSVRLSSEDENILHLFNVGKGRYRGTFNALPPGEYPFVAKAEWAGKKLDQQEGKFLVEDLSLEFFDPEIKDDLLKKLAEVSGGRYISQEELSSVMNGIPLKGETLLETREFALTNYPLPFLLLLIFLTLEWSLRRRQGMP